MTDESKLLSLRILTSMVDFLDIRVLRTGKRVKLPEPKKRTSKNPAPKTPLSEKLQKIQEEPPPKRQRSNSDSQINQQKRQLQPSQAPNQNSVVTKSSNLYDLYTNLYYPHGYTGNIKKLQETLNTFNAYSLHKPRRKNFQRRPTFVPGPLHSIQADLIEYSNSRMAHANSNYKYILVMIDCFTKKVYAKPLKSKKAEDSSKAIDEILSSLPWPIAFFMSDKGGEFDLRNKYLEKVLVQKHRVKTYTLSGKLASL